MVLPRWLNTRTQPIGIDDVVFALCQGLDVPLERSVELPVPGPEILSGREILERTALLMGLSPAMLGVPLLSPRLSSFWIQWVTRANHRIASELVQGLTHDLIAPDDGFWRLVPQHQRLSFDEAARRALREDELHGEMSLRGRLAERLVQRLYAHPQEAEHERPSSPQAHR